MADNIVLTFALLFGSVVALICAVYSYKINKAKIIKQYKEQQNIEQ